MQRNVQQGPVGELPAPLGEERKRDAWARARRRIIALEIVLGTLHLAAGITFLIIGLTCFDFRFAIAKSIIEDVPGSFEPAFLDVLRVDPTWLLFATSLVTAGSHAVRATLAATWPGYLARAAMGFNAGYYAEFMLSAPLLYLINVLFSGRLDISSSILLASLFGAINGGGFIIEMSLYNKRMAGTPINYKDDILYPFIVYGVVGLLVVLCSVSDFITSAVNAGDVPGFVFGVAITTNFFYLIPFSLTFGIQRLAEWRRWGWYVRSPFIFQYQLGALSLFSKLIPAIFIVVGLARM